MDRYEYTVKSEKIRQLAERHDYATAARIAETIDWSRVQNMRTLTLAADVFEHNGQYDEAKRVLLTAYDLVPVGKTLLYKLCRICLKQNKIPEAENYYDAYAKVAPDDPERLELRYDLACARKEPVGNRISILEQYHKLDIDERLDYALAELYHRAGRGRDCVAICDEIVLWFGDGEYVDAALELKRQYSSAVAEERKRRDEAAETRRKRIEELENETGAVPIDLPAFDIPEFGFDDEDLDPDEAPDLSDAAPEDAYDDDAYDEGGYAEEEYAEDPYAEDGSADEGSVDGGGLIDLSVFEDDQSEGIAKENDLPEADGYFAGGSLQADAFSGADPVEDEFVDDEFAEDEFVEDDLDGYDFDENGFDENEFPEDGPGEGYFPEDGGSGPDASDGYEDVPEEEPEALSLSDFLQAGTDKGGPMLETFAWMESGDDESGNVGKWIWSSLEQAERDRTFRPDPDLASGSFAPDDEAPSDQDFSKDLEETLSREVAAFEEAGAPSDMTPVGIGIYEEVPDADEAEYALEGAAVRVDGAFDGTQAEKVALGIELPEPRGYLEPGLESRLFPERMFDEYGLILPDALVSGISDEEMTFDPAWDQDAEPTKRLNGLGDLHPGEEALHSTVASVHRNELVDPDNAQENGSDYLDLAAIAHESEARMAAARARAEEEKAARAALAASALTIILAESSDPEKATSRATEIIHDTRESMGTDAVQSAKVNGRTLNRRGMKACMERLGGRDLIILEADDLDDDILAEIVQLSESGGHSGIIVMSDIPWRLRELVSRCPALARISVYEEESGQAALPFTEAILAGRSIAAEPEEEEAAEPADEVRDAGAAEAAGEVLATEEAAETAGEVLATEETAETADEVQAAVTPENAKEYFIDRPDEDGIDDEMARAFGADAFTYDDPAGVSDEQGEDPDRADMSDEQGEDSGIGLTGQLAAELARMMSEEEGDISEASSSETAAGYADPEISPEAFLPDTDTYGETAEFAADGAFSSDALEDTVEFTADYSFEDTAEFAADAAFSAAASADAFDDASSGGQSAWDMSEEAAFGAVRSFAGYVSDYAASLDCVIDEKANLAVYACAEDILSAGGQLTAEKARALVDDAVKDAEHASFRSVFSKKYDKEGRLILKEQHFHI